jgi:hypothetical protein
VDRFQGVRSGTYYGTHTQTGASVQTLNLGMTESGDTLGGAVNNVVLAGTGLTGTLTVDLSQPLGSTGEAVLATTHPDGEVASQSWCKRLGAKAPC